MNWFKKEETKVLRYGLAVSLIPPVITWAMGVLCLAVVSATNVKWLILSNFTAYIFMFSGLLILASDKEKTRPRLLAVGFGMILLGVFSASNAGELLLKMEELNAVNKAYNGILNNLLQNMCLYVSAAVGGGIVSASIFAEETSTQTTAQPAQPPAQPAQDSTQSPASKKQ
ncbi:hypothetical protein LQR31_04545 [Chromobacterium vaccinii]|uniref:hypothetical protein n=1 Tax=Chromobacterium vaccinii TaxID=1108595 RepID=UPI001E4B2D4E|nr:hypothetical protein [Chromobacterium vaccinii]MCD4483744.1 hypothetical protein [Chromobacterium vaccinii]